MNVTKLNTRRGESQIEIAPMAKLSRESRTPKEALSSLTSVPTPSESGNNSAWCKAATVLLTLTPAAAMMSWMAGHPPRCSDALAGFSANTTAKKITLNSRAVVPFVDCVETANGRSCFPPILPPKPMQAYVAACLIMKDESDFPEWITYHRQLGISAFYIFDHDSMRPLPERVLDDTLERGDVHYQYFNTFVNNSQTQSVQIAVYNECLRIGSHHPWMAFTDVDEYIVPEPGHYYLPDFMRQFEGHCALAINWRLMGSNNHEIRPAGGVVQSFTKCVERDHIESWWTKVIARPSLVENFRVIDYWDRRGPHKVDCLNGTDMIDANFVPYNVSEYRAVLTDKISLYHYVCRSREDFLMRLQRKVSTVGDSARGIAYFDKINNESTATCTGAQQIANFLG